MKTEIIEKINLDKLYNCTDIIESIRQLDLEILAVNKNAQMLADDLKGDQTVNVLNYEIKDLAKAKKEVDKVTETVNSNIKILGIPPEHPMAQILATNPIKQQKEYKIHADNTNNISINLDPSEALILLTPVLTILKSRRNKLMVQLEASLPTIGV